MNKMTITVGCAVGSTIGALLPQLWGDHDFLSPMLFLLGFIGGVIGIWLGYKLSQQLS